MSWHPVNSYWPSIPEQEERYFRTGKTDGLHLTEDLSTYKIPANANQELREVSLTKENREPGNPTIG